MLKKFFICSIISALFFSNLFSGSLSGRVNFNGKSPKKKLLRMDADPICGSSHKELPYRQSFIINEEGYLKNVMIYLLGALKLVFQVHLMFLKIIITHLKILILIA